MEPDTRPAAAERPRAFVAARGPDAEAHLNRMLSNDVATLADGESVDALLLTPKARVIATVRVVRRGPEDFLLLTEPGAGDALLRDLVRTRFAAKVALEPEEHRAVVVLGEVELPAGTLAVPVADYGEPAVEAIDPRLPVGLATLAADALDLLRIRAGTPLLGRDVDDRVLPAEAGLVERHVSFTKGCYPGQEPVARLHYRGHANRGLRVLRLAGTALPAGDAEVVRDGSPVGRVTSAAVDGDGVVALAYVRVEVPDDAALAVEGRPVLDQRHAPAPAATGRG
ncbi:MAG: hypothetical protein R3C15_12310 [Thermoleophilia bacterium]